MLQSTTTPRARISLSTGSAADRPMAANVSASARKSSVATAASRASRFWKCR